MRSSPPPCPRAPGAEAGGEAGRRRAGPGWVQEHGWRHPSHDSFVCADLLSVRAFLAPVLSQGRAETSPGSNPG